MSFDISRSNCKEAKKNAELNIFISCSLHMKTSIYLPKSNISYSGSSVKPLGLIKVIVFTRQTGSNEIIMQDFITESPLKLTTTIYQQLKLEHTGERERTLNERLYDHWEQTTPVKKLVKEFVHGHPENHLMPVNMLKQRKVKRPGLQDLTQVQPLNSQQLQFLSLMTTLPCKGF